MERLRDPGTWNYFSVSALLMSAFQDVRNKNNKTWKIVKGVAVACGKFEKTKVLPSSCLFKSLLEVTIYLKTLGDMAAVVTHGDSVASLLLPSFTLSFLFISSPSLELRIACSWLSQNYKVTGIRDTALGGLFYLKKFSNSTGKAFVSWDRVSLYNPGWPGIHCINQTRKSTCLCLLCVLSLSFRNDKLSNILQRKKSNRQFYW